MKCIALRNLRETKGTASAVPKLVLINGIYFLGFFLP